MKQQNNFGQISRALMCLSFVFFAAFMSARASVMPRVCVDAPYRSGTVTLVSAAAVGNKTITVNGYVPPLVSLVINPGGATQEVIPYVNVRIDGNNPYTIGLNTSFTFAVNPSNFNGPSNGLPLAFAHAAGETVTFAGYSGTAYYGYNNPGGAQVVLPKGVLFRNYFSPNPTTYQNQPSVFQPGIYENVFQLHFGGQATDTLTYNLDGSSAVAANGQNQNCAQITYQGKLSTSGAAANGNYDFQFTVYDAETGGKAQSGVVAANNIMVTNGVFTAPLNFASVFNGNGNARFLQIAVRPAGSTDTFTVLTPRQPISDVPFAVNAQRAFSVSGGFVQLPLTTNAPLATDCNQPSAYGQTRVDAVNNLLYICTSAGWKSTVLQ